jgi:hypothetical protein
MIEKTNSSGDKVMFIKTLMMLLSLLCFGLPVQSISGERHDKSGYLSETDKTMVPGVNVMDETVVQVEMPQKRNFDRRFSRLPNTILKKITEKMKEGGWGGCGDKGDKIEIFSNHFFNLENNKLLLLLGISDYLCDFNTFIPVTVDYQGKWEEGRFISGEPTWLVKGSDNALWLNSQWQIEGTYPSLYHSKDGTQWQEVTLPENRNVDCCFEWLTQICFDKQQIRLKFYGDYTNKTAYWVAGMPDILKPIPKWHQVTHVEQNTENECSFVPVTKGNWIRTESENTPEIRFQLTQNDHTLTVIIPKLIPVK